VDDAAPWIARARAGDREAIGRLVEAYQDPVFNLCYRMLGSAGEAEDVAQETFVRLTTRLDRYDPARPFRTWLLSVAAHACIDRLRQRRRSWLSLDEPLPAADQVALRDPLPGPEEALVRREEEQRVQRLLARLAPEDRQVVVLRYWYDLGYEEIAEATRASVSSVKSRLFRARRALAGALASEATP
jgi:RNA polymerase sigma-70 factor (ECF subfamily)